MTAANRRNVKPSQLHSQGMADVSGNDALIAKVVDRIARTGPIDFARFMEMALYDPEHGYYESDGPIGWSGDFYTSEDLHAVYGEMVARQLHEAVELISQSGPVTIVEVGAGRGRLCRDVLTYLGREVPDVRLRMRYVLIERSARMIEHQRALLYPFLDAGWTVSWSRGLDALLPDGIEGVLFSNELVDAFPVHRVVIRGGALRECFVSYARDGLMEVEGDPSTDVAEYVHRFITSRGMTLHEGMRAEVNLNAVGWMQSVARVLKRGIVVTVDYGYPSHELYGYAHRHGTLLCYARHQVSNDPYVGVGQQDMTAHVDFTALAAVGQDGGLEVTGFTNQQSFLLGLGIAEKTTESNERLIAQLVHPTGLGRTHKVLVQHTGMPAPVLSGLKYRPFFTASLFARGGAYACG